MVLHDCITSRAREYGFSVRLDKYCAVNETDCDGRCRDGHSKCPWTEQFMLTVTDMRKTPGERGYSRTFKFHESDLNCMGQHAIAANIEYDSSKRTKLTFEEWKAAQEKRFEDEEKEINESLEPDWGSRHPVGKNAGRVIIDLNSTTHATGDVSEAGGLYGSG